MGPIVTARNRGTFLEKYKNDYRLRIENQGNPDGLNAHEIEALASKFAMYEIRREKKHLKAFLRGFNQYKFFGRTYPVLTPEVFEQQKALNLSAISEEHQNEEE